jgi:hypothetical protein
MNANSPKTPTAGHDSSSGSIAEWLETLVSSNEAKVNYAKSLVPKGSEDSGHEDDAEVVLQDYDW